MPGLLRQSPPLADLNRSQCSIPIQVVDSSQLFTLPNGSPCPTVAMQRLLKPVQPMKLVRAESRRFLIERYRGNASRKGYESSLACTAIGVAMLA